MVKSVAFTRNGGWVIVYRYNGYSYWNIPPWLVARLKEAQTKQYEILSVAIGPQDQWILITDKWYWASDSRWLKALQDVPGGIVRAEFDSGTCKVWDENGNTTTWTIGR